MRSMRNIGSSKYSAIIIGKKEEKTGEEEFFFNPSLLFPFITRRVL